MEWTWFFLERQFLHLSQTKFSRSQTKFSRTGWLGKGLSIKLQEAGAGVGDKTDNCP